MTRYSRKVEKEEYIKWKEMNDRGDFSWENEFIDKYLDESILFGYGLYGVSIGEEGIINFTTGDSCD